LSLRGAVLASLLCLPAPASLAAPVPNDEASLRADYQSSLRWGRYWAAVNDARRLAAQPGLSNTRRAALLVEGSRALSLIGDGEGVERDLKRALRLKPGDAEASYRLAAALRERPREALPYAEQAARAAANVRRKAAAYRLSGEIRLDLGDGEGARADLERSLDLSGDDLETLESLVRAESEWPYQAAALAARADRAAEAIPPWARPAADLLCARLRLELKDYPNAVLALKRALALEPDNLYALEALVRIKRRMPQLPISVGEKTEAGRAEPPPRKEGALLDALKTEPGDLGALGELIALKRAQKNLPEELAFAERFMDAALEAPRWEQPPAYRFITGAWLDGSDVMKIQMSFGLAKNIDRRSLEMERLTALVGRLDSRATSDSENMRFAYVCIARARAELKDDAGAKKSLGLALEAVPGDPETLRLLSELSAGAPLIP
jgi:tetratricopeptide (TPR) repeat protein